MGDTGGAVRGEALLDVALRADMKSWCDEYYWRWWQAPARVACRGVADTYYTAVRTFGGAFF